VSLPEPSSDSIALVTGASSGIGEQFARQLSELGHRVALVARREDRLAQLDDELGGPDRAVAIGADLALPEDRDRLAARIDASSEHRSRSSSTTPVLASTSRFRRPAGKPS